MKRYLPVAPGARLGFSHSRPVFVIDDLDQLRGPRAGTVTLPLHLDWTPASTYDVSSLTRRSSMYAVVLREAGSEADLAEWLDKNELVSLWPDLNIPAFVRQTWEEIHPALKSA